MHFLLRLRVHERLPSDTSQSYLSALNRHTVVIITAMWVRVQFGSGAMRAIDSFMCGFVCVEEAMANAAKDYLTGGFCLFSGWSKQASAMTRSPRLTRQSACHRL